MTWEIMLVNGLIFVLILAVSLKAVKDILSIIMIWYLEK